MKITPEMMRQGVPTMLLPSDQNCWRESLCLQLVRPRGAGYKMLSFDYMGIPHTPVRVDRDFTLSKFVDTLNAVIALESE